MPGSLRVLLVGSLVVLSAVTLQITAQPPGEKPAGEGADSELARIRVTLERIAELLERQTEGQRVELALRRLDVESERVLRLERQIADVQAARDSLEDERFRMQSNLLAMIRAAERPETDVTQDDLANLREQSELQVGMVEARIGELDRRMLELQNRLAERRETVRSWEAFVDDWLGQR